MSTGLDCQFVEVRPGEWYYELELYSERDQYDVYGPFASEEATQKHLRDNHANPGGAIISDYDEKHAMSDASLEAYRELAINPSQLRTRPY